MGVRHIKRFCCGVDRYLGTLIMVFGRCGCWLFFGGEEIGYEIAYKKVSTGYCILFLLF